MPISVDRPVRREESLHAAAVRFSDSDRSSELIHSGAAKLLSNRLRLGCHGRVLRLFTCPPSVL